MLLEEHVQSEKRQAGRYYTEGNPFSLEPFRVWAENVGLSNKSILEPYAGANNIIHALQEQGYAQDFASFDIAPADKGVIFRDTLTDFPRGYDACVTNPPWLAKNSARRRGLSFPETEHDDLYKHALELCLRNCEYNAALIPATFLQSGIFREKLDSIIFLHDKKMFNDTENPVCLALFGSDSHRVGIYHDNSFVGYLNDLERELPDPVSHFVPMRFNDPSGELGFVAFDNTRGPSIRFVHGEELSKYSVGFSSRMLTRIAGEFGNVSGLIEKLNEDIQRFRYTTEDVFLTPFKGLRKDGRYRRRMDYRLARDFIAKHVNPNPRLRIGSN